MPPKVSVVTCSHNRPGLLRRAVESMRAQTDPDWEHLICDDSSTDPGVMEVLRWARQDPRVTVWLGQENLDRPSVLWNFMLDRARGRYFTVLDDDNEKLPSFVARMSGELDSDSNLDVVTCGWCVVRDEERSDYFLNLNTSPERLNIGSTCDGGAMLYRRSIFERIGYFSEAIRTNEDWDWLRRATHFGTYKNLHEVHATYRSHYESRMIRSRSLGNDTDIQRVRARPLSPTIGARFYFPPADRLTASQRDVCATIRSASEAISWINVGGGDLCVIVSPFQMTNSELADAVQGYPRILTLHMEDPFALAANMERVQHVARYAEAWVCTNDAATVPYYRKLVGERIITCPSLGADALTAPVVAPERDIDVLFCGYAYPSRKRFMGELLPKLAGLRVVLIGDGWESVEGVEVLRTQEIGDARRYHAKARAVVCLHRVYGDCSDGPVEPETVNRGALEGYEGPRVFIDRTRPHHAFDEGDVVWYSTPGELAEQLRAYLSGPRAPEADRHAEKCRELYTYRTRLARMINCVRAPRYLAEIP